MSIVRSGVFLGRVCQLDELVILLYQGAQLRPSIKSSGVERIAFLFDWSLAAGKATACEAPYAALVDSFGVLRYRL